MMKPLLMVRDTDSLVLGVMWHEDPDDGPIKPQASPLLGTRLVPHGEEFTREGRRDTESAYWRDGAVEWEDHAVLEDERAEAIDAIDAAGEALRLAVINRMTTQTEEYRRVEPQARAWRAAGYPESEEALAPRGVRGWAVAKWREGWTNRQACDDILATADSWYEILDTIRDLRLANKEDARYAETVGEIGAIVADMQADMRTLALQINTTTTE
ncbi:hypothetical protein [Massilia brevitalea]|uniref:hypothetical protein n=1 Tax=Massilia brevitalea TaxID=442526 RepID=UPI00273A1DF3|nr:hypothetical protein [Massilia brevitalea]